MKPFQHKISADSVEFYTNLPADPTMEPVVASHVSACGSERSLPSTAHDDHDAADFPEGADRGTSHVGKCGVMSRPIQASPDTIPEQGEGAAQCQRRSFEASAPSPKRRLSSFSEPTSRRESSETGLRRGSQTSSASRRKLSRDIWSLRTWIRATKPHLTSDDHTRSANKRAPVFARLHRACGRRQLRQGPKQVTRAHSEPATAAVPRPSCRLPSLIKTKPGAVDQAGQVADIDDDAGWLMPFDVDVAAASLGRARDPSGSVDTNGEWMQNLFSAQALIPAPAAVDQGQLGQEARVGQDREDDDDLGWLIPAGIEPGRHQPEHAILSCFRVMNLMQGAQCTEREAGTSLSDPFLSDQRALFPFYLYDSV